MRKQSILILVFILLLPLTSLATRIYVKHLGTLNLKRINSKRFVLRQKYVGSVSLNGYVKGERNYKLKGKISSRYLSKIPGIKLLRRMYAVNLSVEFTPNDGMVISSKVGLSGAIKPLLRALRLRISPRLTCKMQIQKRGVYLWIPIFSNKNWRVTINPLTGMRINFRGLKVEFTANFRTMAGMPTLYLTGDIQIKPSKWDKWLNFVPKIYYSIISQEIGFAATMNDTWKHPFRVMRFVTLKNCAFQMGFTAGVPSSGGFTAEKVRLFGQNYGFAAFISGTKYEWVLALNAKRLGMNGFMRMIRGISGFKIPSIFPNAMGLRNVKLYLAPTGGAIGEYEFKPGMEIQGEANSGLLRFKVKGYAKAPRMSLFSFNRLGTFKLSLAAINNIKGAIINKVRRVPVLKPVLSSILNTFNIRYIKTTVEATKTKYSFATAVSLRLFGKTYTPSFKLSVISFSAISKAIVNYIIDKAGKFLWNKMKEYAKKGWNATKKGVSYAARKTAAAARKFANAVKDGVVYVWKNVTTRVKKFFRVKKWYLPWKWRWKSIWKWVKKTVRKRVRKRKRYTYRQRLASMHRWAKDYLNRSLRRASGEGKKFINRMRKMRMTYKQAYKNLNYYQKSLNRYWRDRGERGRVYRFFKYSSWKRNGYKEFRKWSDQYLRNLKWGLGVYLKRVYRRRRSRRIVRLPNFRKMFRKRKIGSRISKIFKFKYARKQLDMYRRMEARRRMSLEYLKYKKRYGKRRARAYFKRNYKRIYNRILRQLRKLHHRKFKIMGFKKRMIKRRIR